MQRSPRSEADVTLQQHMLDSEAEQAEQAGAGGAVQPCQRVRWVISYRMLYSQFTDHREPHLDLVVSSAVVLGAPLLSTSPPRLYRRKREQHVRRGLWRIARFRMFSFKSCCVE